MVSQYHALPDVLKASYTLLAHVDFRGSCFDAGFPDLMAGYGQPSGLHHLHCRLSEPSCDEVERRPSGGPVWGMF